MKTEVRGVQLYYIQPNDNATLNSSASGDVDALVRTSFMDFHIDLNVCTVVVE